nr:cyclin ccl1 [Quercus suber]
MTTFLSEDDIYRTSTQFRLWSYTPEGLVALRHDTHDRAIERIRQHGGEANGHAGDYLTVDEELRLVQRYCEQIRTTSDHFQFSGQLKATAVQYMKRFYTSNSCMTYPPKEIYKTVLYIASKVEHGHMKVAEFGRRIATDAIVIQAPEYKIMQALRFTLDVKQPHRGAKGVQMELLNLAGGKDGENRIRDGLMTLEIAPQGCRSRWKPPSGRLEQKHLEDRIEAAYYAMREVLDAPALLTDAYFLWTPSQIMFAALSIADLPLFNFYLSVKLPVTLDSRPKILATIKACADVLASFETTQIMSKEERAALEAKLERCRDPTTRDLVKNHNSWKQGSEGKDEDKTKRRKLAREESLKEVAQSYAGLFKRSRESRDMGPAIYVGASLHPWSSLASAPGFEDKNNTQCDATGLCSGHAKRQSVTMLACRVDQCRAMRCTGSQGTYLLFTLHLRALHVQMQSLMWCADRADAIGVSIRIFRAELDLTSFSSALGERSTRTPTIGAHSMWM